MQPTDYLSKQNRDYFMDRPIYKSQIDLFRKKLLPLYKDVLSDDETIIYEANGSLFGIYSKQGYRSDKLHS